MYGNIVIFCIVLFIYLHVQFHLKTSNDLEIYEIRQPTKDAFEEACNTRQPVVVNGIHIKPLMNITRSYVEHEPKFANTELQVRQVHTTDSGVPLKVSAAFQLFEKDDQHNYYSDSNHRWISETGIAKILASNDRFFRPPFTAFCMYDWIFRNG